MGVSKAPEKTTKVEAVVGGAKGRRRQLVAPEKKVEAMVEGAKGRRHHLVTGEVESHLEHRGI